MKLEFITIDFQTRKYFIEIADKIVEDKFPEYFSYDRYIGFFSPYGDIIKMKEDIEFAVIKNNDDEISNNLLKKVPLSKEYFQYAHELLAAESIFMVDEIDIIRAKIREYLTTPLSPELGVNIIEMVKDKISLRCLTIKSIIEKRVKNAIQKQHLNFYLDSITGQIERNEFHLFQIHPDFLIHNLHASLNEDDEVVRQHIHLKLKNDYHSDLIQLHPKEMVVDYKEIGTKYTVKSIYLLFRLLLEQEDFLDINSKQELNRWIAKSFLSKGKAISYKSNRENFTKDDYTDMDKRRLSTLLAHMTENLKNNFPPTAP